MSSKYSIIIDTNAWNFLAASNIDLFSENLSEFEFFITLEIAREMEELANIPDKKHLYDYFISNAEEMASPLKYFGFYDNSIPSNEQRFGGFGSGGFASITQVEFIEENRALIKNSKRKIYYGNEADLLIASRGGGNTYILTEDISKSGPLKLAENTIFVSRKISMSNDEFSELLIKNVTQ